jgi:hypothetical protein
MKWNNRCHWGEQEVPLAAAWVSQQLGGASEANSAGWYRCSCPAHAGDAADTLSLRDGPSGLIVKCFKGCTRAEVRTAIMTRFIGGQFNRAAGLVPAPTDNAASSERFLQAAARILQQAQPIAGTLVTRYLRRRGIEIDLPPTVLRFHPWLYHRPSNSFAPAMVAAVRDVEGKQCAIHRTWLHAEPVTKANVPEPRMTLCPTTGCAVRLSNAGDEIIAGEGIETILSVMQRTGKPGWAAMSAAGLVTLRLPVRINQVTIAADNDPVGLDATDRLHRRLLCEGRTVRVIVPPVAGDDFNDVLLAEQRARSG